MHIVFNQTKVPLHCTVFDILALAFGLDADYHDGVWLYNEHIQSPQNIKPTPPEP